MHPTTRALAAACAVLGVGASSAHAAPDPDPVSCGASALRVLALPEPAALGGAGCATAQASVLSSPPLGPVAVGALEAATTRSAPDDGRAAATVDRVRLGLPGGLAVELRGLTASARAHCVDGAADTAADGAVGSLTVGGRNVPVGTGPQTVKLPLGLGSLHLNRTERTPGGIVRRALHADLLTGDVVAGEARARIADGGCRTAPTLHKRVLDAEGRPVLSRDAAPGDGLTYQVTYRAGSEDHDDVAVEDVVRAGQAVATCVPDCTIESDRVRWALGDVPAGQERVLTLTTDLDDVSETPGARTIENTATATGGLTSETTAVRVDYAPQLDVRHEHLHYQIESNTPFGTAPIVLTGDPVEGVLRRVVIENTGAAPAEQLTITDVLADAFSGRARCEVVPRTGARIPCSHAPVAEPDGPKVLDPAGTPRRITHVAPRLERGARLEVQWGGDLQPHDHAADHTTVRSDVTVTHRTATVPLHPAPLAASREKTGGPGARVGGLSADDPSEEAYVDEDLAAGAVIDLAWGAYGNPWSPAARGTRDVVATMTVPEGFEPVTGQCHAVATGGTCSYDPETRRARFTVPFASGRGWTSARLRVRASEDAVGSTLTVPVTMTSTLSSDTDETQFRIHGV